MLSCHDDTGCFHVPQRQQCQQQTTKQTHFTSSYISKPPLRLLFLLLTTTILPPTIHANDKFNPYQLNGGLVSAIAGSNYVILASDTRLTDGGYEILSRRHLSSRLWGAAAAADFTQDDQDVLSGDGSIIVPMYESFVPSSPFVTTDTNNNSNKDDDDDARNIVKLWNVEEQGTMVASAGCASDCEALKRIIRSEINARAHWSSSSSSSLTVSNVATLLAQTLYSRRSFPFYSFCVVAGISHDVKGGTGNGSVYVYDAIGSFERVAVACAGVGKEMLQPILDRLFVSSSNLTTQQQHVIRKDKKALSPEEQRVGLLTLQPPVQTQVDCDAEEAVSLLVRAYRSVAEREIEVGDDVVVCVVKCLEGEGDGGGTVQVLRFPLKKH